MRATDSEEAIKADGHPVGQQLLHGRLGASEHQFGLSVALLLSQSPEQSLHYLSQVRQVVVERHGQ